MDADGPNHARDLCRLHKAAFQHNRVYPMQTIR